METIQYLLQGLSVAMQPMNLLFVTLGGILGTIIGMVPGLGPATGIAILIPITFGMDPTSAIITMSGVYYGAMYGGSRSSILINTPGDGAAVAATFDGYPMTKNGKAESALAISAIASFIGGMIATIAMVLLALPVARFTTKFGPAEYFMLMILALAATASMAKGKKIKATISILIGLMISVIGIDFQSGVMRFTYGNLHLLGGIDFLVIIIAIYALGEIFGSYKIIHQKKVEVRRKFGKIRVTKDEFKKSLAPILRAAPVGFLLGALPGAGGTMAALMAYNNEKNISNEPETFGEGNIVGLAAPESANNAASVGALIPMFTLGIPGSGTTAVMLGALMMLGLQPGPQLFTQNPEFVWGVIASMFIGNIILAYVNIPLAGLLVQVLRVPSKVLFPIIAALAFIGIYSIGMSEMDLYLLVIFGIFGFFLKKAGIPTAPLILAVIVGNTMEQTFRQALTISDGDFGIFLGSPLAITLLVLTILSLIMPYSRDLKSKLFSKA